MNSVSIVKVRELMGRAKSLAWGHALDDEDLVILTISLEKVEGDPVSYLLSQIEENEVQSSAPTAKVVK